MAYGASVKEWDAFIKLSPEDILPVVSKPGMQIGEKSKLSDEYSKIPSKIAYDGCVYGIKSWATHITTEDEIKEWRQHEEHGICLVGRKIKAIDVDVEDEYEAHEIEKTILSLFNVKFPKRYRSNSYKFLMLFRIATDRPIKKHIIHTLKGVIEFLADRQHFVVAGTHKTKTKILWEYGYPTEVPEITEAEYIKLIRVLEDKFSVTKEKTQSIYLTDLEIGERNISQIDSDDPEFNFVVNSKFYRGTLDDGKIAIECPWTHLHESTGGQVDANEASTVYFPKGLGGKGQSAFKCFHTSHGVKSTEDFLEFMGFGMFPVVVKEIAPINVTKNKNGKVLPYIENIKEALKHPEWIEVDIAFDAFASELQIKKQDEPWAPLVDTDYTFLRAWFTKEKGFAGAISKEMMRDAVAYHGEQLNQKDAAIDWAEELRWDGTERLKYVHTQVLKAADTPYNKAVVKYMFTAMIGRILFPGAKADMIPVLIGPQGVRKSTFVKALAPFEDWAGEIDISSRDADNARLVRGKVVIEIPELKGLSSKHEEFIKAWVTRTDDEWIPKFREHSLRVKRRFIMIGTSNYRKFLSDLTGNRRWLPIDTGTTGNIDTDYLMKNKTQLFAEAKVIFNNNGKKIMWEEAEKLAKFEVAQYVKPNPRIEIFNKFLEDSPELDEITTMDLVIKAMFLARSQVTPAIMLMAEQVLLNHGWTEMQNGKWVKIL